MVQVAVIVGFLALCGEESLGFLCQALGQDLLRFVGLAPSGGGATVEHRYPHEFAHGRNAQDAQFAGLAGRPETVIFIELAGRQFELLSAFGRVGRVHTTKCNGTHAGDHGRLGRAAQQIAAGHARFG